VAKYAKLDSDYVKKLEILETTLIQLGVRIEGSGILVFSDGRKFCLDEHCNPSIFLSGTLKLPRTKDKTFLRLIPK